MNKARTNKEIKKYTLEVTKTQAEVITQALEILARLGIGQWRDAIRAMPLQNPQSEEWHDDMALIGKILSKHTNQKVDGWQSSLSISGDKVSEASKTAWDLYQVIRKELSWDYAIEHGFVAKKTDPRNWNKMMGVNYDDPMQVGLEPLAKII